MIFWLLDKKQMTREILENGMAGLKVDFEWAKMNGTFKLYRSTKYMTSMKYCSTFAVHYYSNKRSLVIVLHSSEKSSTFCSGETLQNLPYYRKRKPT